MGRGEHRRREPEKIALSRAVPGPLNEFLERADARVEGGCGLPKYVREEFKRYLESPIPRRWPSGP